MKRMIIVGAGTMARLRARALLATGEVEIVGVAARHLPRAQAFGAEVGCARCVDDYRRLTEAEPAAVLVEVPHAAQDDIVLWALEQKLHVLIGGVLAGTSANAGRIRDAAAAGALVVEAGFEARYAGAWIEAKRMADAGELGRIVAVRSIALWGGDPATWYYDQEASGGMPLTHMTYCFVNPLRWLLGDPLLVSAFANRVLHTGPGLVREESCVANLLFKDDVLGSLTAGFVKPGNVPGWSVTLLGTQAAVEVCPCENGDPGRLVIYRGEATEDRECAGPNAFHAQARAFVRALGGHNACRNGPAETVGDVRVAEALVASTREQRVVTPPPR